MPGNLNEPDGSKNTPKANELDSRLADTVVNSELVNEPAFQPRTDDQAEKEVHQSMNRVRFPQVFGNVNPFIL